MYYGVRSAPEDAGLEEKVDRGGAAAVSLGVIGGAGAALGYLASPHKIAFNAAKKSLSNGSHQFSRLRRRDHLIDHMVKSGGASESLLQKKTGFIRSATRSFNTGVFIGGGAAIGAGIGAAVSSNDRVGGAAKGAMYGAGAGLGLKLITKAYDASKVAGKVGTKVGGYAGLALVAAGGFAAIHARTRQPDSLVYGADDGSGGTEYNDAPLSARMRSMNAQGDLVFGLHRGRH
jgi:hypothetical protein